MQQRLEMSDRARQKLLSSPAGGPWLCAVGRDLSNRPWSLASSQVRKWHAASVHHRSHVSQLLTLLNLEQLGCLLEAYFGSAC